MAGKDLTRLSNVSGSWRTQPVTYVAMRTMDYPVPIESNPSLSLIGSRYVSPAQGHDRLENAILL